MLDLWLFSNILLFAVGLITVFVWIKAALTFLNALASMVSFYGVSPHADNNVRSANQFEYLSGYVKIRDKATNILLISTLLLLVIVFIKFVMEVFHAIV